MYAAYKVGIPIAGFIANSGNRKLRRREERRAYWSADFITSPLNPNIALLRELELASVKTSTALSADELYRGRSSGHSGRGRQFTEPDG